MPDGYLAHHPGLIPGMVKRVGGERRYRIALPDLPERRWLGDAFLIVPKDFPSACASIQVDPKAALLVPHVGGDGEVCFSGDPGPGCGLTPEQRLHETLTKFFTEFVLPWADGKLDNDFEREARTYWSLYVESHASKCDPIAEVYTTEPRTKQPKLYVAPIVDPARYLIAGADGKYVERVRSALGIRAQRITLALIAEIPVDSDLTPQTWPRALGEVERLLSLRLSKSDLRRFDQLKRKRRRHRVVILRSPNCAYAYLLGGGPPIIEKIGKSVFSTPPKRLLPLKVRRLDPSWTYGRDQHPVVPRRSAQHAVVFGAGALGGHAIDQLARAGIGAITIVDNDRLESANIGRHLLGVESLGRSKARCLASNVGNANPACNVKFSVMQAQAWLKLYGLKDVDLVVDLTGEPLVRAAIEDARRIQPTALLIGWMEPFVAAAHACQLPPHVLWFDAGPDRMQELQAVEWPLGVMRKEPACNSEYQAYTSAAAAHAVALISEAALEMLDAAVPQAQVVSWVRGQAFLDTHYPNLILRDWAAAASRFDGVILRRTLNEK